MLLTICTTHRPATDLGYLLHKHPERFQSFDLSFGQGVNDFLADEDIALATVVRAGGAGL